jgi:hypothetical protein
MIQDLARGFHTMQENFIEDKFATALARAAAMAVGGPST